MGTDFPTGMKGPPILAVWVIAALFNFVGLLDSL